jgi:GT2 family glycosyltransferase
VPEIAVITIVRGRLDHLAAQQAALRAQPTPYERVIVQMGGPDVRDVVGDDSVSVVHLASEEEPLPLAAARNAGVRASTAERMVLLDVDCIPAPGLLARYAEALDRVGGLVAGPVSYLPPGAMTAGPPDPDRLEAIAAPHPARPVPADGELLPEDRYDLFWSLSFAMRRADWNRIGGFCELYQGYGGEDTDFAWLARGAGVPLHWVGGAIAWHQHHDTEEPPLRHLGAIVRNSRLFHRRWGCWPMVGWLEAFKRAGLVRWTPTADVLELTPAGLSMSRRGPSGHSSPASTPTGRASSPA